MREAVREANEVLKDAVKIIPPGDSGEGGSGGASGMIWDGTDMWMLPTSSDGLGSARERASLGPETQTAVASRALALLHRLQSDPSIIQRDPEAEEGMRDEYRKWVEEEIKAKGGVEGPEWSEKTGALLKEEMMLYEMYTGLGTFAQLLERTLGLTCTYSPFDAEQGGLLESVLLQGSPNQG